MSSLSSAYPTDATSIQYAGFWARIAAHLVDLLVASVLFSPFEFVLFFHSSLRWDQYASDPHYTIARCTVSITVWWLYAASLESSSRQATLGKRIVGLKVTDLEDNRISFSRATARFFGAFLCDASCGIGYLMVAFSKRKQALHDMISRTVVVASK
jgi:uncharacterized RDD family membrane protein YckC